MTSKNKRPKSALPLAFTEHGVVMLSSVLRSDIAVQTSVLITRAFVAMRQMIANSPVIMSAQLQKEMKELKEYIEDVFADQNDINEDTRMQIELINQVLAELQVHKKLSEKTTPPHRIYPSGRRLIEFFISSEYSENYKRQWTH